MAPTATNTMIRITADPRVVRFQNIHVVDPENGTEARRSTRTSIKREMIESEGTKIVLVVMARTIGMTIGISGAA